MMASALGHIVGGVLDPRAGLFETALVPVVTNRIKVRRPMPPLAIPHESLGTGQLITLCTAGGGTAALC